MQFALLIYERPHDFDRRHDPAEDKVYTGAWQAWHKALVEAGVFVGGSPLEQPDTGTAKHHFCSVCGIKSFYVPRSHPDGLSVNARCLDAGTVQGMTVRKMDGVNWEQSHPKGGPD